MKLVVGLGNPGRQYDGTRHNVGYDVLGRLAQRENVGELCHRFSGRLGSIRVCDEKVWLLWPETYMNRSGSSVQAALAFFKIEPAELMVVCDDLDSPLGRLRIRARGSDGGHRGLRDIIGSLGSNEFPRMKIGIGPRPPEWDAADFVLARFRDDERQTINETFERAADAVLVWCTAGIEKCMNEFNRKTA